MNRRKDDFKSDETVLCIDMLASDRDAQPSEFDVVDVLTIGAEKTVLRPVERAIASSGLAMHHASDMQTALRWLERNVAAVVVAEVAGDWVDVLSCIRGAPNTPEVILIARENLSADEPLALGAFDLLREPLNSGDLLWSIASAWHSWMQQLESRESITLR
jgi:DNA-binding NtrC family response regulator